MSEINPCSVAFLKRYQAWRIGIIEQFVPGDDRGPDPKQVSTCLDWAITLIMEREEA